MTEMTDDVREQANLLDAYRLALAHDPAAAPPIGLDPGLGEVAWCLARDLNAPESDPLQAARLRGRLEVQAAILGARMNGARTAVDIPASPPDTGASGGRTDMRREEQSMAHTVHETIRELAASTLATLESLVELADQELEEPSSHVCAQGKDVWTLITNDIDHEKIHAGQILEGRYEARITQSQMQRLIAEWLMERARLIGALVGLSDEQFNQETAPGGWTYRAVAKHTLLVEQDSIRNMQEAIACREAPDFAGADGTP